jgi:hypothetical protein
MEIGSILKVHIEDGTIGYAELVAVDNNLLIRWLYSREELQTIFSRRTVDRYFDSTGGGEYVYSNYIVEVPDNVVEPMEEDELELDINYRIFFDHENRRLVKYKPLEIEAAEALEGLYDLTH